MYIKTSYKTPDDTPPKQWERDLARIEAIALIALRRPGIKAAQGMAEGNKPF